MKVVHVLRKPCSEGTVAANVLRWGTGALNIDAARVGTLDSLGGGATSRTGADQKGNEGWTRPWMADPAAQEAHAERVRANVAKAEALGRWPANLVLQHLPGCRQEGTRTVKSDGHYPAARPQGSQVSGPVGHKGQEGLAERHTEGETVAAWTCAEGCPVAALDAQSGVSKSTGGRIGNAQGAYAHQGRTGWGTGHTAGDPGFGDTGGASRFFRQFGGDKVHGDPLDG
jgi:hypothetical protein